MLCLLLSHCDTWSWMPSLSSCFDHRTCPQDFHRCLPVLLNLQPCKTKKAWQMKEAPHQHCLAIKTQVLSFSSGTFPTEEISDSIPAQIVTILGHLSVSEGFQFLGCG
jgi:hypothetical protein